ncbi:MAG: tetratricopeptide repeat protein [Alphaproteobacteria bacterium]
MLITGLIDLILIPSVDDTGVPDTGLADYMAIYMVFLMPIIGVLVFMLYGMSLIVMLIGGWIKLYPWYVWVLGFVAVPLVCIGLGFVVPWSWLWVLDTFKIPVYEDTLELVNPDKLLNKGLDLSGGGLGVTANPRQATAYFKKAAELGQPDAMQLVAISYEGGGGGLPQNDKLAWEWYVKSAQTGNTEAMIRVAEAYEKGELGQPILPEQAKLWREKAVK